MHACGCASLSFSIFHVFSLSLSLSLHLCRGSLGCTTGWPLNNAPPPNTHMHAHPHTHPHTHIRTVAGQRHTLTLQRPFFQRTRVWRAWQLVASLGVASPQLPVSLRPSFLACLALLFSGVCVCMCVCVCRLQLNGHAVGKRSKQFEIEGERDTHTHTRARLHQIAHAVSSPCSHSITAGRTLFASTCTVWICSSGCQMKRTLRRTGSDATRQ